MNNSPISKMESYLRSLKKLLSEVDLSKQMYKEGTTAGQIAFHTGQAANFWLKVRILESTFDRDKDSELTKEHTSEEINTSIDSAIQVCEEIKRNDLNLESKLKEEVPMDGGAYVVDTIGAGLIFITSHTAEHVAELTMIRDYFADK